ncbi:hypothetical protein BJ944DRAFT_258705 [Cunninghamella echinulata]|nr:hypothetical protein BJ944DRAFT_258705 [Cunninghamella echinulata]
MNIPYLLLLLSFILYVHLIEASGTTINKAITKNHHSLKNKKITEKPNHHHTKIIKKNPSPSWTVIPGYDIKKFQCHDVTSKSTFVQCEIITIHIPQSTSYIKPTSTSKKSTKTTTTTKKPKKTHHSTTTTSRSKKKKKTKISSSTRPTNKPTNNDKSKAPKEATENPNDTETTTTTTTSSIDSYLVHSPVETSSINSSNPTTTPPSTDVLSPEVGNNADDNRNLGIGLGVGIGCIAAIALAGLLIYNHRHKNGQSSSRSFNSLGNNNSDEAVNTRWRTQSFMGVVAAVVAKLPRSASLRSKSSSMNSQNNNHHYSSTSMNATGLAYTTSHQLHHNPSTSSLGSPPPLTEVNNHVEYQHRY